MKLKETFEDAYLDLISHFIFFNKLSRNQFEKAFSKGKIDYNDLKYFRLVFHEMRHWIDLTSTLWGQNYLRLTFLALEAILKSHPNKAKHIDNLKKQFAENKANRIIYKKLIIGNNRDVWKWRPIIESANAVFCIEFLTQSEERICKAPITMFSLLECNAIYEEVLLYKHNTQKFNEFEKITEDREFQNDMVFKTLYNSELIEYSVACHLTSGILGISNLATVVEVSSCISTLVLNLPIKFYSQIPFPNDYQDFKIFGKKIDIGFIYFLIVANYKKEYQRTKKLDLESILRCSNLPDETSIKKGVLKEMEKNRNTLKFNTFENLYKLYVDDGKDIFNKRNLGGMGISLTQLLSEGIHIPKFIFSDDGEDWEKIPFEKLKNKPVEKMKYSEWFWFIEYLKKEVEE